MGLRREEIDSVCTECGKITAGPHKGETMQPHERVHLGAGQDYYKATPISGTVCEDCKAKPGGYYDQMAERHGPDWREKLKRIQDAQASEKREKPHIWWRKPGE